MGAGDLERGREAYARRAWRAAYEALSQAGKGSALDAEDLERLATVAYLLARDDESAAVLERAHVRYVESGMPLRAVRCAFWLGIQLVLRGEVGPGSGWLARAEHLLESSGTDGPERGYLLLPEALRLAAEGQWESAVAVAREAAEIAEHHDDPDLFALATHERGHLLVVNGRVSEGLPLLDEAMVAATSRVEHPIVTGVVYCGVILACVEVHEVRRAREWTDVLTRWCEEQPDLVAFTGRCRVHRAEILQFKGEWPGALAEARLAEERLVAGFNRPATAQAFYRQGELHRLRGEFAAAEKAFEAASRHGFEPQPGLALLRLAQGRSDVAESSVRRALAEVSERSPRALLLAAGSEIFLARGDLDAARDAARELAAIAAEYNSSLLAATARHADGAVALESGDATGALRLLRSAAVEWSELEAPYEAARSRVLIGVACRELGDEEGGRLELEAARETFLQLGALPDSGRVEVLLRLGGNRPTHGLTTRELEVLRLVSVGSSNREIAAALVISEHTVARHVQNIFAKLDVSSRTAAASFAFEHGLV